MADEAGQWHGWAHGNSALFISPAGEDDHLGLYVQQDRSTELAAVFVDPAMAQVVMDWLDEALKATGEANNELITRLMNEQPLLFAGQPAGPAADDDDDEDDGE